MKATEVNRQGRRVMLLGVIVLIIALIGLVACGPDVGGSVCHPSKTVECTTPTPNPTP